MNNAPSSRLRASGKPSLIVRADAGSKSGAGHVMRCLALMQAWRARGGAIGLATANCPEALISRIRTNAGAEIARISAPAGSPGDADETAAIAAHGGASWIVVDGYDFDAGYVRRLRKNGLSVLLLDDLGGRGRTDATIVLNQNLHAESSLYTAESPSTTRLLGLAYLLLREEFWPWRGWTREFPPRVRRIGIALGGADPFDQTRKVIEAAAAERLSDVELAVVVGAANPRLEAIRAAASRVPGNVIVHADLADMASFLSGVDLLVSSAGVTVWEGAFLSTPMLLGTVGPQEEALVRRLAASGACIDLGPFEALAGDGLAARIHALVDEPAQRRTLGAACSGLIDGRGCERVTDVMLRQEALVT